MRFIIAILCGLLSHRGAAQDPDYIEAQEDLAVLHSAMTKYLKENGSVWPQLDQEDRVSENQISKFWHDVLKPYGAQAKHWEHSEDPLDSVTSYLPANFKSKKDEAYRWKKQPWFVQTFRAKTGMWLVCLDGNPKEFKSETYQDLAALHSAMVKCLEESDGIWPHPGQDAYESELSYSKFWIETLKPYGAEEKHWVHSSKPLAFGMDYMPSLFDDKKNVSNRWEKQPWFMPRFKEQIGMWVVRRDGEPRILKPGTVPVERTSESR